MLASRQTFPNDNDDLKLYGIFVIKDFGPVVSSAHNHTVLSRHDNSTGPDPSINGNGKRGRGAT